jgi:hypothetical protein
VTLVYLIGGTCNIYYDGYTKCSLPEVSYEVFQSLVSFSYLVVPFNIFLVKNDLNTTYMNNQTKVSMLL